MTAGIEKVGIVGAGQMGTGIALVCAQAGLDVRLHDVDQGRIKAALATINGLLARTVSKGALDVGERNAILARIAPAADYAALADRDLVIEAATEVEEVKRRIFVALRDHLRGDALVASNTSSISITRLAS